jgi:hypothetical protein
MPAYKKNGKNRTRPRDFPRAREGREEREDGDVTLSPKDLLAEFWKLEKEAEKMLGGWRDEPR